MLIVCGTLVIAWGAGMWLLPTSASAMPTQQEDPPPRPPVEPLPPDGDDGDGGGGGGSDAPTPTPMPSGRITGTVIDQSTGAPVPGVEVSVGGVIVRTDANGNYERTRLRPGTYKVKLWLSPNEGTPLQEPQMVVLVGQTANVVVHLFFTPAGAPVPTPTAVPAGASQLPAPDQAVAAGAARYTAAEAAPEAPVAQAAPSASEAPAARSSRTAPEAAAVQANEVARVPSRLPNTGAGNQGELIWLWLMLGTGMLIAGALLQMKTSRDNAPVLAEAVQTVAPSQKHSTASVDAENAETLKSLFDDF
jgi:pyruvate/2-oxoglutarate dehydrogenase complex dihydrolipoamide acyltransferase (E2) component